MTNLTQADHADLLETLAYALRRTRSGKATQQHANVMALAAAEHLADAMRRAGFVVMRGPPAVAHSAASSPGVPPVPEDRR